MPIVILIMKRKPIAQGFMNSLKDSPYIRLIYQPYYHRSNLTIHKQDAKVALIEVAETGAYDIGYCLVLCDELRETAPECKLILMCSDQDEKTIDLVIDAMVKNYIDDFVLFDVTIQYLVSKLISV